VSRRLRRRPGYSLLELAIVLAIAAILVGLMVPAILKVRETSARTDCQQHLKQLGLGWHGYHDSFRCFPPGGKNGLDQPIQPALSALFAHCPSAASPYKVKPFVRSEWSWAYHILPFIGQDGLHRTANDEVIKRTPLALAYCPSRRAPEGEARIDYAGCAGTNALGADGVCARSGTGLVTFASVKDGTSSTLLLGEKQMNTALFNRSYDDNGSCYAPGWGNYAVYRQAVQVNGEWQGPKPDFSDPHAALDGLPSFGSAHLSGANFAFCDGSVRLIRYEVDGCVFHYACSRDDGHAFSNNDL
jgi:prepilin-type N-terminal cleavage/methylation domain-containing protein/prepilin-type processing-associated H-X9-DG protein